MRKTEFMIAEYIKAMTHQEVGVEIIEGMVVLEKDEWWHIYIDRDRFVLIGTADEKELDNVLALKDIRDGIVNIYEKVREDGAMG